MADLDWHCMAFRDLSNEGLYDILKLRSEVFVMEQDCVYQDMDDYDQDGLHVSGTGNGSLLCYARLLSPGKKYAEPCIGRILNSPKIRGQGYGKVLVTKSLEYCAFYWPDQGVRISAQLRLQDFYHGFGFVAVSDSYLEDGIPHIEMLIAAKN